MNLMPMLLMIRAPGAPMTWQEIAVTLAGAVVIFYIAIKCDEWDKKFNGGDDK